MQVLMKGGGVGGGEAEILCFQQVPRCWQLWVRGSPSAWVQGHPVFLECRGGCGIPGASHTASQGPTWACTRSERLLWGWRPWPQGSRDPLPIPWVLCRCRPRELRRWKCPWELSLGHPPCIFAGFPEPLWQFWPTVGPKSCFLQCI